MNQLIETIYNDVINKRKPDIPKKVAINAIHYYLAVAASLRRAVLLENEGHTKVPINYFGITFAKSGIGKSLAASIAKQLIDPVEKKYYEIIVSKMRQMLDAGEGTIPLIEYKEGTTSGLMADRSALDVAGIGSSNIHVEELLDVLKSGEFDQVLNMLIESWQEGKSSARKFRSYVSPNIDFVPTNCILYGSPEGFRNDSDRRFKSFEDTLSNGLARRSYIVFDESEPEYEDEPTLESITAERLAIQESLKNSKAIVEHIKQVIVDRSGAIEITISIEAELELRRYESSLKNQVSVNPLIKNAVRAEMLSRAYKIRRLAALYALYDGGDTVSTENVLDAIEWSESLSKDLAIVLNAETAQERIYDFLTRVNRYVSQTEITKWCGISIKDFKEAESEIYTVAYDNGSVIQRKVFDDEAKVIKYNLIKGKATSADSMICSASNHQAQGYEPLKLAFNQIPDLISGKYGSHYSAGTFINKHRLIDNYIRKANLIIFDVDEGTTIEDAKIFLQDYRGFISTTRNHQKQKDLGNGRFKEACDRFRVVLVAKFEFNLSPEDYKETLKTLAEFLSINADVATIEVSRMYFANADAKTTKLAGDELIDIRQFVPQTKEVERTKTAIKAYETNTNINAFDRHFLQRATVGARNNELFKLMVALIDHKGADYETARAKVLEINSMLSDPLSEAELEKTVFKSAMRK